MIVEYIRYKIGADRADAFVTAYQAAGVSLRASPECLAFELARCAEDPECFILRIEWQSIDAHLKGFRTGPAFKAFFAAIQPYVKDIEEMRHYQVTPVCWSRREGTAAEAVPTLFEWMGGMPMIERIFETFYRRVPQDPLLAPLFAELKPDHARHVAVFVAQVLGGPQSYPGGHPAMGRRHLGRKLTEAQRSRWMQLLLQCADDVGCPSDPEFRSALTAYLEWGSRLAVINSQPDATVDDASPMPHWGWGEVKGPYVK